MTLLHLPDGLSTELIRDAPVETATTLPTHLTRSLPRDQGSEMGRHHEFTLATDIPVSFYAPARPW